MSEIVIEQPQSAESKVSPVVVQDFKDYVKARKEQKVVANDKPAEVEQTSKVDTAQNAEPESETGEDTKAVEDTAKPVETKNKAQKRIDELSAQREAQRARAEAAEAKLAALEAKKESKADDEPKVEKVKVTPDSEFTTPKPEMHQFTTIGEYTEALSDWKDEKREFVREQARIKESYEAATKKNAEAWNSREVAAKADIEDYDVVVNMDSIREIHLLSPDKQDARTFLADSEHGPKILFALLEDDAAKKKFDAANPIQQIKILTKIESKFELDDTQVTQTTTTSKTAIEPPPKLKPGVKIQAPRDLTEAKNFSEYMKLRKAGRR